MARTALEAQSAEHAKESRRHRFPIVFASDDPDTAGVLPMDARRGPRTSSVGASRRSTATGDGAPLRGAWFAACALASRVHGFAARPLR